jgi:predicted nucleic acid-binding protein
LKGFLLDTNCVSEGASTRPDPNVKAWLLGTDDAVMFLSVLTLGEIRKGIESLSLGRRRSQLEQWLELDLRVRFATRVVPVTESIADRWGRLDTHVRKQGRIIPAIDGLLAATALEHNLTLVTRNTRDFAHTHISVFNPWTR